MAYSSALQSRSANKAAFAVISRLLSCLVTESLLHAFYFPLSIKESTDVSGLLVVLSAPLTHAPWAVSNRIRARDIFAVVPLRQAPVLATQNEGVIDTYERLVALLDPLDMSSEVYDLIEDPSFASKHVCGFTSIAWDLGDVAGRKITSPDILWKKFARDTEIKEAMGVSIERELMSSFYWQKLAYDNPPQCPEISSPSIQWEQSLVSGHPTHPMHRARSLPFNASGDYDWYHPKIRFVNVPRSSLDMLGPFEEEARRLADGAARLVGKDLPAEELGVPMPVHELQIPLIVAKFRGVTVLDDDIYVRALAQSSIRTVVIPQLPGKALKLSVGVKISSSLRTISHYTADFGPRFSRDIVPRLTINPEILSVEREPSSAVYHSEDPELAKHFTAIFRNEYEPLEGQNLIVCAALLETGHAGVPEGVSAVEHAFGLDTETKRTDFLDRYIRLACEALVPPLMHNGVAFEAHAQNVLARFDTKTEQLLGFVVRDLGGLRIHPPTLVKSTGVKFEFLTGHCVTTSSVEEAYPKFYHTLVHNHLQRLIRVLGMHYNGRGWEMLRRHLEVVIPADHGLREAWLSPEGSMVAGKCLMRMRLQGVYRDMVYSPFPNLIQHRPEPLEKSSEAPAEVPEKRSSILKILFSLLAFSFLLFVVV